MIPRFTAKSLRIAEAEISAENRSFALTPVPTVRHAIWLGERARFLLGVSAETIALDPLVQACSQRYPA